MYLFILFSCKKDDLKNLGPKEVVPCRSLGYFCFLCALLAILKSALKKRLSPQNSTQKSLDKCHPSRSQRELPVSSGLLRQNVCCGFLTTSCFRAKVVPS